MGRSTVLRSINGRWGSEGDTERICWLRTRSTDLRTGGDYVTCNFSYFFIGLRDSSVISLLEDKILVTVMVVQARHRVVKGRHMSRTQLVAYHRIVDLFLLLDMMKKRDGARGRHARSFFIRRERDVWPRKGHTRALTSGMAILVIRTPHDSKFTSHLIDIGFQLSWF